MKTWIPDERNFAYLTWKQVDELDREKTLLVLPTAAIEQHGHHLPLATDTLINGLLLGGALALLPAELPVYALPAVQYGKSNEHLGFPGTLSVSTNTFLAVVRDIGASLAGAGFRRLVLYNTHGGNSSLIDVLARDLRAEFGLRTFALHGSGGTAFEGLSAQERAYGFHAGEVETAFLLAGAPELVDTSAFTVNYIADVAKPELLLPENGPATFAWLTQDLAESGVLGDPRGATAEKGERWIATAAARLAEALQAMATYAAPFESNSVNGAPERAAGTPASTEQTSQQPSPAQVLKPQAAKTHE
jgi:creatinine amidohydrolase